jgi:hypothetical protein
MSNSVMLERCTPASIATPQFGLHAGSLPSGSPAGNQLLMVPRCELRFEKCTDGFKIHCCSDDEVACATLQNLCKMTCDGLCSCCCTMNGIPCCQFNLCLGTVRCEMTKDGCCISCTSGDKGCCEMLHACCDCLASCCEQGCCCYISFGNTTVCCGKC